MDKNITKIAIYVIFLAAVGCALFIPQGKEAKTANGEMPAAMQMEGAQAPGDQMAAGPMMQAGPLEPGAENQMPPGHPKVGAEGMPPAGAEGMPPAGHQQMGAENMPPANTQAQAPKIGNGTLPVLAEFMSPECPVCTEMAPTVKKLSAEFKGKIDVQQINVLSPDGQKLGDQYRVDPLPTFILFDKNGESFGRFENKLSEDKLRQIMTMLAKP